MNVIIIAAIGLLVLVVLAVIFIGRAGTFAGTVQDCESKGGNCLTDRSECEGTYQTTTRDPCFLSDGNKDTDSFCCLTVA